MLLFTASALLAAPACVNAAKTLMNGKDHAGARDLLLPCAKQNPKSTEVLNLLGTCYNTLEKYDSALIWLDKAQKLDSRNPEVALNIGYAHYQTKGYAEAEKAFKAGLDINPGSAMAWTFLGESQDRQHRFEEAIVSYRKALELAPGDLRASFDLAVSTASKRDYATAEPLFEKLLEAEPNNTDVLNNLGVSQAMLGKTAEAIITLKRSVAIKDKNPSAWANLALALESEGDLKGALAANKKYLATYEYDDFTVQGTKDKIKELEGKLASPGGK